MANEYALKQARNTLSCLKDDLTRTETDIFAYSKCVAEWEKHKACVKQNITEMEEAIVVLERAQKG
jgi:septal ring factor EnvC (AmiA/AmiB activator)